jgi:hypothetical protein
MTGIGVGVAQVALDGFRLLGVDLQRRVLQVADLDAVEHGGRDRVGAVNRFDLDADYSLARKHGRVPSGDMDQFAGASLTGGVGLLLAAGFAAFSASFAFSASCSGTITTAAVDDGLGFAALCERHLAVGADHI